MKSFAVIDLETDPFKRGEMPAAFAGGIYDGKSMMIYWDERYQLREKTGMGVKYVIKSLRKR